MKGAFGIVRDCLRSGQPVALATALELMPKGQASLQSVRHDSTSPPVVQILAGAKMVVRHGEEPVGSLGERGLDLEVAHDAQEALRFGKSVLRKYAVRGEITQPDVTVFIEVFVAPRRMVIFGAVDFTAALVRIAKVLNYRVTVCDARGVFATSLRFPEADEVIVDWPQRYLARVGQQLSPRDAICVLTHDPKFDIPAIVAALETQVGYLGAMGSRHTHAERIERLRREGIDEAGLGRIMAPIGIDIGARTTQEVAVAIIAEIIAVQARTPVPSLRDKSGPIHREAV